MENKQGYGPEVDRELFSEISAVMRRHPEAAKKYQLKSIAQELELGVDLEKELGISRVEGRTIITEFVDRTALSAALAETGTPDGGTPDGGTPSGACRQWRRNPYTGRRECLVWET
jgi:hypothetical protein